ncbi:3-oxoadipate enol-lactonase [Asanoa ishikariensis]|uniref:3-oxoadipate enol-lactonase n=1 Tax=Asanoa ishikariensis TaxID=137265 RepID=A0A1H3S8P6_9ACTN|nr:3-oxoadipate enol-lactonase [Asanoa ishikariensis]GIF70282.1 3-oxoadipate enol-lactonase [Asanoa ishikariensis]SDZ34406.1 3-oxoadipate enol-lactonase [Asanoa ishikariensis]
MLAYEAHGPLDAPVVLLGSSLGTTGAMWAPQMSALRDQFRVVTFDHRGHGGSPVPPGPYTLADLGQDVLALLDHLGLARVHYAGLSLGGMVGMWLAAHAPERVDRLALLCTAAHLPPATGWHERAATVRAAGMSAVADAVVARWFTPGARPSDVAAFTKALVAIDPEGYAGCCEAIAAMDLRPVLPRITAPTLVVAGEADPATPPVLLQAIVDGIPGSASHVLPDAAHLANVEQADRVTDLLRRHFTAG